MKTIIIILSGSLILALAYFVYYFYIMRNVKIPTYRVISQQGSVEIRQYDPMIIAEVTLAGERNDTINHGFKVLAAYIFGENISSNPNRTAKEEIAMTAPVMHQKTSSQTWQVRFVMPKQYSLNTLPKPKTKDIKLISLDQENFVVIRYSGSWSERCAQEQLGRLMQFVKDNKLQVIDSPIYAYYNPPFTPPFMRRNEIMLKLEENKR